MLIVVTHFIDEDMKSQVLLLELKKIQKKYSNVNETILILKIFEKYEINDKLSYFVDDNAKINDIMLKIISKKF